MPVHTLPTLSTASPAMTLPNIFILWFLNHGDLYYSCWRDFHLATAPFSTGREWRGCSCASCLLLHVPRSAGLSSSHHTSTTWASTSPNLKANAFLITRVFAGTQSCTGKFKVNALEEMQFNLQSGLFLLPSPREGERKKCHTLSEIW